MPTSASAETPRNRRGRLLDPDEQERFLELLSRGAGRVFICRKMRISYDSYLRTVEQEPEFREAVRRTLEGIDQNVETALYRSAMEGNVTAQTFWLRYRRPAGWQDPDPKAAKSAAQRGAATPSDEDDLESLSDRELLERARAEGIDLAPEIVRRLEQGAGAGRSGKVPRPAQD
ncbi:MAG: hypothetical protein ACOC46_04345 [Pirellulales bacterium]